MGPIEYIRTRLALLYALKQSTEYNKDGILHKTFAFKDYTPDSLLPHMLKLVKGIRAKFPYEVINYDEERATIKSNLDLGGGQWEDFKIGDLVTVVSIDAAYQHNNPYHYSSHDCYHPEALGKTYVIEHMYGRGADDYNLLCIDTLYVDPTGESDIESIAPNQIRLATDEEIKTAKAEALVFENQLYDGRIKDAEENIKQIEVRREAAIETIKNY